MKKLYWLIEGYDGSKPIFKMKVGLGQFTVNQIQYLLKALAGKAGLDFAEIVGAYAKRGTAIANGHLDVHLDVHKDFCPPTYMCGSNPHFTARVVDG